MMRNENMCVLQSVSSLLTKFRLGLLQLSVMCNQCLHDLEQVATIALLPDLRIQFPGSLFFIVQKCILFFCGQ